MIEKIKSFFINLILWSVALILLCGGGTLEKNSGGSIHKSSWVVLLGIVIISYLCIKSHGIIACAVGLGIDILWRIIVSGKTLSFDLLKQIILYFIVFGVLYLFFFRFIFGKKGNRSVNKSTSRTHRKQKLEMEDYDSLGVFSNGFDRRNDYFDGDYYDDESEKSPRLVNGSDEYWEACDSAEKIYRLFCDARTYDSRKHYKELGETLKRQLYAEYGRDDESVKSICERYLDLRL